MKKVKQTFEIHTTPTSTIYPQKAKDIAEKRSAYQKELNENDKKKLNLYQLKYQLEKFIESKSNLTLNPLGSFIEQFVNIQYCKRKDFAKQISISESMLSQYINGHRIPPDYFFIRLELYSQKIIPAELWVQLANKIKLFHMKTDLQWRKREMKFVKGILK